MHGNRLMNIVVTKAAACIWNAHWEQREKPLMKCIYAESRFEEIYRVMSLICNIMREMTKSRNASRRWLNKAASGDGSVRSVEAENA